MNLNLKHLVAAFIVATFAFGLFQPTADASAGHHRPHRTHHHHRNYGGPCHAAVDTYWPAQHRAWAHRIVTRESNGLPTAANRRSSARGCFQMLLRYSAPFYRAVGCTNAMWSNATCNVRAALVMFQRAGKRPWRL